MHVTEENYERHHPTGGLLGANKEKRDLILVVKIRLYTPAITIVVLSACTGSGSSALPSPAGFAADPAPSPSAPRVTGPAVLVLFVLRALKRASEPVARYCRILLVPLLLGQGLPRHDPQSQ